MNFPEISIIGSGLAMDACAVSLAAAASGYTTGPRPVFRLAFHFGLFQFLMPVIGWAMGMLVVSLVSFIGHWIAFGLLTLIGVRMIRSGIYPEEDKLRNDPTRGITLVMLSVATSIDALAVGVSLAMLKVNIWYPSMVIGIVTAFFSLSGIAIGRRIGTKFGPKMEMTGGLILILIGLRILTVELF
ncbi:manganese efflux pump MntP family protein [Fibrobacterota bacterium]